MNITEKEANTSVKEGKITFDTLMTRPEFGVNPEKSIVSIIRYGLNRYRAGVAGVWPSYVRTDVTGGETEAPEPFAAAFRVDGLGTALLALKHAQGAGYNVSGSIRDEVENSVHEYVQDRERMIDDLAITADLTSDWGHQALVEAVGLQTE